MLTTLNPAILFSLLTLLLIHKAGVIPSDSIARLKSPAKPNVSTDQPYLRGSSVPANYTGGSHAIHQE